MRQHSVYQEALARGSVERVMLRLAPELEQIVTLRTPHFNEVRDGVVRPVHEVEPNGEPNRSRMRQ